MIKSIKLGCTLLVILLLFSCKESKKETVKDEVVKAQPHLNAKDILGNPIYLAISYGGYRAKTRDLQPTISELKDDMKILSAMGVKMLRTYNVHLPHASNVLKAIQELKAEDANFEMYVMLGIWIDCKSAFDWSNGEPDHSQESERNSVEVKTAIELAQQYPEIIKVLAVGNEAMVKWANSYYVEPWIILKWVNHLQDLKKSGDLSKDLWITSSDNYASWGGGSENYHVDDLDKLIKAVDFISLHTYPMHDTHHNPETWGVLETENELSDSEKINAVMLRAKKYAISQYESVVAYMKKIGVERPIHIGETGWASYSGDLYGASGSKATDEYKEAIYYRDMREWTNKAGMSCFYFEAFDENWKDGENPEGSENHFGLFKLDGTAKYAIWDLVDNGVFEGLTRNGNPITKTYNGNKEALMEDVFVPAIRRLNK